MGTGFSELDDQRSEFGAEIVVLVTAASLDESEKIARSLVESGLAACANILSPIKSIFSWEHKITETMEVLLLFKTRSHLFGDLAQAVKKLHSYQVPEIIALPIVKGTDEYLDWITENTRKSLQ